MKFQWVNDGITYAGELLGFVCPAGTVCGVMLPADGFVHVVAADMLREYKESETLRSKQPLSPNEEHLLGFLENRDLAASLLHAYATYVGTTMEICKEDDCWMAVARAARTHIAPTKDKTRQCKHAFAMDADDCMICSPKGEPAILRLELKPPHSGVGVLANKSFQSKITIEAAKSALQSIYQLALEYGWKMDQPSDVFLGDLLRRYVKHRY